MSSSDEHLTYGKPSAQRYWYWPLYPTTWLGALGTLAMVFFLTYPSYKVRFPAFYHSVAYGPIFGTDAEYQHGWPFTYARRDVTPYRYPEPYDWRMWRPWDGLRDFDAIALFFDVVVALSVVLLAAGATQWWRSRRRHLWQWGVLDLAGLTAVIALVCAWAAAHRSEYLREEAIIAQLQQQPVPKTLKGRGGNYFGKYVTYPIFLPDWLRRRYWHAFQRVVSAQVIKDTELVCQFAHLKNLQVHIVGPDFGDHLERMPQLEMLTLASASLYREDAEGDRTVLRDLPPMPKLRFLSLQRTGVCDQDLQWLTKCPRLEAVDLGGTEIGDEGLKYVGELQRLRFLMIYGDNVTDEGCRLLANIPSLEDLILCSRNVHDEGVLELAQLPNLRRLKLRVAASEEAISELRNRLPNCTIEADMTHAPPRTSSDAPSDYVPVGPCDPFAAP